jgi:hypothetical protein
MLGLADGSVLAECNAEIPGMATKAEANQKK